MIELDDWQKEVLDYNGDLLLCTGRRVGKTYILARKAIDLMAKKPKTPIVIVSLTEDQAMIIMSMAQNYAKESCPHLIGKGRNKPTLKSLHINGGKMIVRPVGNTGDGARGFEGGVLIVDEASRMPKMFWIAAKPLILTTNGQIWLGSTPFGAEGYFWERYDEAFNKKLPNARYRVFCISTEEMVARRKISLSWTEEQRQGALRILEEDKKEMSVREYSQEYLGHFVMELSSYFRDEIIEKCCVLKREEKRLEFKHYGGFDFARMGEDEGTAEIIMKIDKDNLRHVENIITKKRLATQTEQLICELYNIYHLRKIGIDAGAGTMGVVICDFLIRESFGNRVVALNNRARSMDRDEKSRTRLMKEDMYANLLALMEQGKLLLLDDDSVIDSLRSVQYEYLIQEGKASRIRIFGKNTHVAEGLIRAAWIAVEDKSLNIWVR